MRLNGFPCDQEDMVNDIFENEVNACKNVARYSSKNNPLSFVNHIRGTGHAMKVPAILKAPITHRRLGLSLEERIKIQFHLSNNNNDDNDDDDEDATDAAALVLNDDDPIHDDDGAHPTSAAAPKAVTPLPPTLPLHALLRGGRRGDRRYDP